MKYYTETIPVALAEKLKEKGMPIGSYVWMPNGQAARRDEANLAYYDDQLTPYCTYAEVFDWLLEKEFVITIRADYYLNGEIGGWIPHCNHWGMKMCNTWHDAANAAIEKALTLI